MAVGYDERCTGQSAADLSTSPIVSPTINAVEAEYAMDTTGIHTERRKRLFLPVLLRDDNQHDENEDAHNPENNNKCEWESSV